MGFTDIIVLAGLFYLAPPLLLAAGGVLTAAAIWLDLAALGTRFALSKDVSRRWDLQRGTERFSRLRGPSFLYVFWTLGNAGVQAVALYRISSRLLSARAGLFADLVRRVAIVITGIDISPYAHIGPGFTIHHGQGIVIGKNTWIGADVTFYHDVTTGSGRPRIEDGVIVWPGARIIGDVTIGRDSEVGANAVVLTDVPPSSIAVGVPANRIIPKAPAGSQAGQSEGTGS